jgi:hypothetical protein
MLVLGAAAMYVNTLYAAATILLASSTPPHADPVPYHTSILTGQGWVMELLNGHPERIKTELGMQHHVFLAFVTALRYAGLTNITLHEQVAISLYMSVTGLNIHHVGERFQHANETISQ